MAKQVQFRRGTTAEHQTFKGAVGELTVDTDRKALILHDGETAGGILVTSTGTPLGVPLWHNGARNTIDAGYVAMDGQLLNRADFPNLWARIQAKYSLISDSVWLSTPTQRVKYSSGNGTTTFRMPDLNGIQTNSIKSPVLRGDGYAASGTALGDAIRDHNHILWTGRNDSSSYHVSGTARGHVGYGFTANENAGDTWVRSVSGVDVADENRPNSAFGVWICRVGDTTAEVADPTRHALLTGGNTFNGSQSIAGGLEVAGTFNADIKPLLNATGSLPIYALRTWGIIQGTSTPARLVKGVNVASIVDEGVGQYKVTFTTPMPDVNYLILLGTTTYSNSDVGAYGAVRMNTKTVNGFSIICGAQSTADIPEVFFGVTY